MIAPQQNQAPGQGEQQRAVARGTRRSPQNEGRNGQLDAVDRTLCRLLQDNARMSNAALARAVGMSPPAVVDRLRRLEAAGVITGYRAQLDPQRLGYGLTVLVAIALGNAGEQSISAFREAVADVPEVVECHHVTGTADFMLKVVTADVTAYRQLLMARVATLPGVQRVESSVVLETVKSSRGIAVPWIPGNSPFRP